jgi:hypothetical protein
VNYLPDCGGPEISLAAGGDIMKRTLITLGLVTASFGLMTSSAIAAPNNKNNADNVIPLECEELGEIAVRPNPGNGLPAWDVESGEHQVAKQFTFVDEVTVTIEGGDSASTTFSGTDDYGAENGNKDLVECTATFEFNDGPFPIDAEFAAILNADFETDIFEEGQFVTISSTTTLTVLAMITGR